MKNIFIITLGTREIQHKIELKSNNLKISDDYKTLTIIDKNSHIEVFRNNVYNDFICHNKPREAGKIILENLSEFNQDIEFPLIEKAFEKIIKKNNIDEIYFVYTDQKDLDFTKIENKRNFLKDTVGYKDILKLLLIRKHPELINTKFSEISVTENVTDIDYQYNEFGKKCKELYENIDNIKQIFLLAQGGIDQINHSLTLQLLQAFKDKVKIYQQAEADNPQELKFPFLFMQDLNKQKIIKHAEDYNFGLIDKTLTNNTLIKNISEYAFLRLSLNHSQTGNAIKNILNIDTNLLTFLKTDFNNKDKINDLYFASKINLKNKNYSDFLWRIFTLVENIYTIEIENNLNIYNTEQFYDNKYSSKDINEKWQLFLEEKIPGITKKLNDNKIWVNNPNRNTFQFIHKEYISPNLSNSKNNSWKRLYVNLEKLSKARNKLAHELKSVDKGSILSYIKGYSIDELCVDLETVLELSGFGVYDRIKKIITRQL